MAKIKRKLYPKQQKLLIAKSPTKTDDHYYIDHASFTAANYLDISIGYKVLDMCAAPGGKSVVLAKKLLDNVPLGL